MKHLFLLLALAFFACKKDDPAPVQQPFDTTGKTLLVEGNFSSDSHTCSGTAKVYTDGSQKYLVFQNFRTDSGPDLRVYLSSDLNANNYVEIAVLEATAGNFYFPFDKNVDEKTKNKVLIWCEDFSVLFGHATLN